MELCMVLIKAQRGQLWKGKQNKNSGDTNWKKEHCCQTFYNYKTGKHLVNRKMTSFRCLKHIISWNLCISFICLLSSALYNKLLFKTCCLMEQHAFKNVNSCMNTNIYSYLETSQDKSYNLYLNVVHFFNTSVN